MNCTILLPVRCGWNVRNRGPNCTPCSGMNASLAPPRRRALPKSCWLSKAGLSGLGEWDMGAAWWKFGWLRKGMGCAERTCFVWPDLFLKVFLHPGMRQLSKVIFTGDDESNCLKQCWATQSNGTVWTYSFWVRLNWQKTNQGSPWTIEHVSSLLFSKPFILYFSISLFSSLVSSCLVHKNVLEMSTSTQGTLSGRQTKSSAVLKKKLLPRRTGKNLRRLIMLQQWKNHVQWLQQLKMPWPSSRRLKWRALQISSGHAWSSTKRAQIWKKRLSNLQLQVSSNHFSTWITYLIWWLWPLRSHSNNHSWRWWDQSASKEETYCVEVEF